MNLSRRKILISAYACEPNKGSEPGVGWNWTIQIAEHFDVWVITRSNNKSEIDKALKEKSLPQINCIYFDLPKWLSFWKKGGRGVALYYFLWQFGLFFVTKKLHNRIKFDLIHHITFGNYRYVSLLPLLKIPFVWGPLGGGDTIPRKLLKTLNLKGRMYEYMRFVSIYLTKYNPFIKLNIKKSSLIIARTKETSEKLSSLGAQKVTVFPESGIRLDEIPSLYNQKNSTFSIISIGVLLPFKGYHLSIRAFRELVNVFPNCEYVILGDGPEKNHLKALAKQLNIDDKVHLLGKVPRKNVLEKLATSHVMVHPSLHDAGPWAILEAMACGLPIICMDLGGPAFQVTNDCGIKIPAQNPDQVIRDMGKAMITLATDQMLPNKMGDAAKKRVLEHFEWSTKGKFVKQIYDEILLGK